MKRTLVIAAIMLGLIILYALTGSNQSTCCGSSPVPPGLATQQPPVTPATAAPVLAAATAVAAKPAALPRLLDLGADKCRPCKLMAPILEDLKTNYAGRLNVEFVDVWKNPAEAKTYGVEIIPTQIFFGANGKELFRHQGFFAKEDILAKWQELGVELATPGMPPFSRWTPAAPDPRSRAAICFMCDGDANPQTRVIVTSAKGKVTLCSPHCYFILYSSLTINKTGFEKQVTMTDEKTGNAVPAPTAVYLAGVDGKTGRPFTKAFADRETAAQEQQRTGGDLLDYAALQNRELANRCGFCDRAVYPEDAARVLVAGGSPTWGCCSHCALGVAARTGKNIEIHERDRLTGSPVVVKTVNGQVASLEPATAGAWFGQSTKPDGGHVSAGCFHQGFFTTPENLRQWVEAHPLETGEMISIQKALADKMALSPQQISKACKIGECAPK